MKTLLNCAKGIRMSAIYGLTSILLTVGSTSCNLIPIVPPGSIKSVNVHLSGNQIVDPAGNSLYFFSHDVKGDSSVCTGDCLAEWPAFFDTNSQVAPPLKLSDFSTFTRKDGSKQTAYKGWPLYRFAGDKKPGDFNGNGFEGVWFVAEDYSVMIAAQGSKKYLCTIGGKSLYRLSTDRIRESLCVGQCIAAWPAFSTDTVIVPCVLKPADFFRVTRPDGLKQYSYIGIPLYTYFLDKKRADTVGQGIEKVWFLIESSKY